MGAFRAQDSKVKVKVLPLILDQMSIITHVFVDIQSECPIEDRFRCNAMRGGVIHKQSHKYTSLQLSLGISLTRLVAQEPFPSHSYAQA